MQLTPISRQVAVIFGASSGIGRETALRFAQRGAKVVVAARSQSGLQSLVQEIRAAGGEATAMLAEVTEFEQVKAVADQAVATYGKLDTWVHTAAVALYAELEETTPEEFKRVIDVNLTGMAYGAMAALPHLKRNGGALVLTSSVAGVRALPYQSAYSASKFGIIGMADALRLELAHEKAPVSVTTIMPTSINTPFFNKARTKLGVKPMGVPPIYQPHIVADAIIHAAEHPTRAIIAGDAGKIIAASQKLSPEVTDAMMLMTGFEAQKTDQPKSVDDPNNLFDPISGYDKVEGDFSDQAQQHSYSNLLDFNPAVRDFALGAAISTATFLGLRSLLNGRKS
jgi:NAD(P)-dependent dehydrogenase (short-subunit alcohol dehydrogenase family)